MKCGGWWLLISRWLRRVLTKTRLIFIVRVTHTMKLRVIIQPAEAWGFHGEFKRKRTWIEPSPLCGELEHDEASSAI